jgi:hypothetical protein
MDRDLARAMVLERCACYDRALDSARKVLERYEPDRDEAFWARKIIRSLGEVFLKQRFADKAMECYQLIIENETDDTACADETDAHAFETMGPLSVTVSTRVSRDVHDILTALQDTAPNMEKSEAALIREGIYMVLLKYATHKNIRELIFEKLSGAMSE